MPPAWIHGHAMRLTTNHVRKFKRMIERARARENTGMGDDTEESAQDQIGYCERLVRTEHCFQP